MRWKRERVGTRSQIEMSLFVLFFKKTSNIPLVFIGSRERVLPDLKRGSEQTQTPEKSTVKKKGGKAKLRATLYRNHKKRQKKNSEASLVSELKSTLREFHTSAKPYKENSKESGNVQLTLNCDEVVLLFGGHIQIRRISSQIFTVIMAMHFLTSANDTEWT